MFQSLEEAWADLEEQVIPADIGWAERKNLKNCFFNGAMALWNMMGSFREMPLEEGRIFLEKLWVEMNDHLEREKSERELDDAR